MTVRQVAARLAVSSSMVYSLIASGTLATHRVGRCIRVSEKQIVDYLQSCQHEDAASADRPKPPRHLTL
ncbi:MAG: helix-turn-helix domain-containing protein [Planctomycetota bacterium]